MWVDVCLVNRDRGFKRACVLWANGYCYVCLVDLNGHWLNGHYVASNGCFGNGHSKLPFKPNGLLIF